MTEKITVENIKCGGCMNSIKTALLKIHNVQEVIVDKDTETVYISSSLPFDREEITRQLAKMGYPTIIYCTWQNHLLVVQLET
jgi:copper chaperone CopZ